MILVVIASSISFSTIAHGYWFFRALTTLGSSGTKALDMSSKVIGTANALDSMIHRRRNSSFEVNRIEYNNGKISLSDEMHMTSQSTEYANQLRIDAWEKAKTGAHLSAKRVYEESLAVNANSSNTWHGYGWTLSELKMYDGSTNAFTTAIYLNNYSGNTKHESESWRYLGWNYHKQGLLAEAEMCYQESLAINPNNKKSKKGLIAIQSISIPNTAGSKKYRITAQSGLIFRLEPSTKAYIIDRLPYDSTVKLLKYIGNTKNIAGDTGRWAQVTYQDRIGYVFGAYIEKISGKPNQVTHVPSPNASITPSKQSLSDKALHYHGQRSHKHNLPTVGLQHQHNNGPRGSSLKTNDHPKPLKNIPVKSKYIVQAGAFSSYKGAKKHITNLHTGGYQAVISKRMSAGRQLYNVEFIGFKDMNEARLAKKNISQANPKHSFFAKEL